MYIIKGYWTENDEIKEKVDDSARYGIMNAEHEQWDSRDDGMQFESKEQAIEELEKVVGKVIVEDSKNMVHHTSPRVSQEDNYGSTKVELYSNKAGTKYGIVWQDGWDDYISSYKIKKIKD